VSSTARDTRVDLRRGVVTLAVIMVLLGSPSEPGGCGSPAHLPLFPVFGIAAALPQAAARLAATLSWLTAELARDIQRVER